MHPEVIEVCDEEQFQPSCLRDEVLLVNAARFGRMQLGHCGTEDFGFLGCHKDVLQIVDGICSGQRECSIFVSGKNEDLMRDSPCNRNLVSYLEVDYNCIKG